MGNFESALSVAELYNIKRDCELLKRIVLNLSPKSSIMIIPYASLFCYEVINYLNKKGEQVIDYPNNSIYSIEDIRNKAKFFDARISQQFSIVKNVDMLQNIEYINYMNNQEAGKWNIHDNIGITFDKNGHIIFNTHYGYYVFQDEKLIRKQYEDISTYQISSNPKLVSEEINKYAKDLGSIIGSISDAFSNLNDFSSSDIYFNHIDLYIKDFNANRVTEIYSTYKYIRIYLLHILSSLNYVLFYLKKGIIRDSGWLLRIEYISYHYIIKRLLELKTYVELHMDEINDRKLSILLGQLNLNNKLLINSGFRNCMVHYGLKDKNNQSLLKEECLNLGLPLCGLVESIFDMSYLEYQRNIEAELECFSSTIAEYLDFDLRSPLQDDEE